MAWDLCRDRGQGGFEYTRGQAASEWIYKLLKDKYRILHYSGDTDGAVPTLGTVRWLAGLDWPITTPWTYFTVDGQLGGYYEDRGKFTFMTIHGAGHMAPQFKRPETYYGVFNWLFERPLAK